MSQDIWLDLGPNFRPRITVCADQDQSYSLSRSISLIFYLDPLTSSVMIGSSVAVDPRFTLTQVACA